MFIIKRLLQLQAGRFSFRHSEILNVLGVIGGKKKPLIPFDPDMQGCLLLSTVVTNGTIKIVEYRNGYAATDNITISTVVVNGTLAPAS